MVTTRALVSVGSVRNQLLVGLFSLLVSRTKTTGMVRVAGRISELDERGFGYGCARCGWVIRLIVFLRCFLSRRRGKESKLEESISKVSRRVIGTDLRVRFRGVVNRRLEFFGRYCESVSSAFVGRRCGIDFEGRV